MSQALAEYATDRVYEPGYEWSPPAEHVHGFLRSYIEPNLIHGGGRPIIDGHWVSTADHARFGQEWSAWYDDGSSRGHRCTGLCTFVCLGEMASLSGRTEGFDGR